MSKPLHFDVSSAISVAEAVIHYASRLERNAGLSDPRNVTLDSFRASLERARESHSELIDALAWALDQIEDSLDPEHQAAFDNARALVNGGHTA